MCVAAAALPMILSAAGTAVSVLGSIQQGRQESAYAEYQAKQTEADAVAERSAAQIHAEKIRKAARLTQGEANASLAASGVDVGSGSAALINKSIGQNAEEDALTAILEGNRKADRMDAQGEGYKITGQNAKTASYYNAGGSLLAGGYQIAKGWKTTKKAPVEERNIN